MIHANPLRSRRARLAALCLAVAGWTIGCGPGVGGTGNGETQSALLLFGATAAAVCSSDLAAALACPAPGTTAAQDAGTALLFFADAVVDPRWLVRVEGNEIELTDSCARLSFRGEWGAVPGKPGRYFGYTDPDGQRIPATLEIVIDAAGLQLAVRDLSGAALLGPIMVTATPSTDAPAPCG